MPKILEEGEEHARFFVISFGAGCLCTCNWVFFTSLSVFFCTR